MVSSVDCSKSLPKIILIFVSRTDKKKEDKYE